MPTQQIVRTDFPVAAATMSSQTTKPTADRSSASIECEDSNAKIFKLMLNTDASANTSWTLCNNSDNIFQSSSSLDSDADYVERIFVSPNNDNGYRFEVHNIGEGCYKGYVRGTLMFESCGDGVHDFTLNLPR